MHVKRGDWLGLGGAQIHGFDAHDLPDMIRWMRRYTDRRREMDLADATLCWLAIATGITEVMTVDEMDFQRYRLPGGKRFVVL